MFEPLFYYNSNKNEVIPWLATGFSYNADFTSVTVTLRDGVTWSDGKPFGIDDVVFTLEMLLENGRGKKDLLNAASLASAVKGVTKVDGKTIRIDFTEPTRASPSSTSSTISTSVCSGCPPMSGGGAAIRRPSAISISPGLAGDDGPVDGHALHRQPGLHGPARQLVGRGRGARADAGDPARDHDPGRHARPDGAAHRRNQVDIVNDVQIAEVMRQLMTQNPKITSFTRDEAAVRGAGLVADLALFQPQVSQMGGRAGPACHQPLSRS